MRVFKDTEGREWTISVTVSAVKRVRDLCKLDLLDVVGPDGGALGKLSSDPVLLANVLYVLCKPKADERGITDEQFGEALAGDAIEAATAALLEDLVDFFPKPKREVLRKMLEAARRVEARQMERATVAMDQLRAQEEAKAEAAGRETDMPPDGSGGSSTSVPPSPA